jgi:hypothetical protein
LRDAPLRREDALDERTISLDPRAGELLLDVAKVLFGVYGSIYGLFQLPLSAGGSER